MSGPVANPTTRDLVLMFLLEDHIYHFYHFHGPDFYFDRIKYTWVERKNRALWSVYFFLIEHQLWGRCTVGLLASRSSRKLPMRHRPRIMLRSFWSLDHCTLLIARQCGVLRLRTKMGFNVPSAPKAPVSSHHTPFFMFMSLAPKPCWVL